MEQEIENDLQYWIKIGQIIDCQLHGFTDRNTGVFKYQSEVFQIPGWLAEKILTLKSESITRKDM